MRINTPLSKLLTSAQAKASATETLAALEESRLNEKERAFHTVAITALITLVSGNYR